MYTKKRSFNSILGIIFLVLGTGLMLNSFPNITGFATASEFKSELRPFFGVIFILIGLIFLNMRLEGRVSPQKGEEIQIFVSNKALERMGKDHFVRANLKRYITEINKIKENPIHRQQEMIQEFHVSPRGENGRKAPRVAWHYDRSSNRLYIDDLLYHQSQGEYVDNWNQRVRTGRVTLRDYINSGYRAFSEVALS